MKKLNILKACLDFFWIFAMIAVPITLFILFLQLLDGNAEPVRIKGTEINPEDALSKTVLVIVVICQLSFIYSIYLLRNIVDSFRKMDIFNIRVIRNFNLMGKLIACSSLITHITLSVYRFQVRKHESFAFDLDSNGFDSFLISISLGLFFMVISEVFKIAKSAKEENELTI